MTDPMKPTAAVETAKTKVYRAMRGAQPNAALKVLMEQTSEMLNVMTATSAAYARIERGDFRDVMKLAEVKPTEVEDLDGFNALIVKIANCGSDMERMRRCRFALAAVREAIDRWQSKIDRFRGMSVERGNSVDEVATALTKTAAFQFAIDRLKERGEVLTMAHDAARRTIERALKRDEREFAPMYVDPNRQ